MLNETYVKSKIEEEIKGNIKSLVERTNIKDVDILHKVFEYFFETYKECNIDYINDELTYYKEEVIKDYHIDLSEYDVDDVDELDDTFIEEKFYEIEEELIDYVYAENKQWIEEVINEIDK